MKLTRLLKSAAVAVTLGAMSLAAHADLVFEWSFTNVIGNVAGTVSGKIYGLSDNATGAASKVTIDSYPSALDSVYAAGEIDTSLWNQQYQNLFTVTGGAITAGGFWAQNTVSGSSVGSQLYINGSPYNFVNIDGNDSRYVWSSSGFSGVTFSLVDEGNTVPEPASLALVGLALTGLAVARRRRA
jgi:hypothetical protein